MSTGPSELTRRYFPILINTAEPIIFKRPKLNQPARGASSTNKDYKPGEYSRAKMGNLDVFLSKWNTSMIRSSQAADPAERAGTEVRGNFSHRALSILRDGRDATLATLRPDGWPQATVINYVNDEVRAYFACATTSQKAQNIKCDDRVSLTIVVPYPEYGPIFGLSLAGNARRLSAADDIAHVLDLWKERHPYSTERVETDNRSFAYYAVEPIVVTMLDYKRSLGWGG